MIISSNALLNRIEIIYYKILTSVLSGFDRIRDVKNNQQKETEKPISDEENIPLAERSEFPQNSKLAFWLNLYQSLIPLIMWIILGFAAGFLIGLITPK